MSETFEIEERPQPARRSCPACGRIMAATDVICINCGFDVRLGNLIPVKVTAPAGAPSAQQGSARSGLGAPDDLDSGKRHDAGTGLDMDADGDGLVTAREQAAFIGLEPAPLAAPLPGPAPGAGPAARAAGLDDSRRGTVAPAAETRPVPPSEFPDGIFAANALARPARLSIRSLLIVGAVLLAVGAVLAMVNSPAGAPIWLGAARGLRVLFWAAVETGLGVGAILGASVFVKRSAGSLNLAAARMLVAVGAFLCVSNLAFAALGAFGPWVFLVLGVVAYWLTVLLLFRPGARAVSVILGCHAALYVLLLGGIALEGAVWTGEAEVARRAPATPAGTAGDAKSPVKQSAGEAPL
ncbi:hypothetical protein BH11PLA1_BH11PLA1_04250 [soil metagenome]